MSMDVADLFIKVDTTDLNRGKDALGGFAKAGNAAEDQTKKLNAANILAQSSLGRYAAAFANPTTAALAFAAAMLAVGVKSVQAAEEARLSIVKLDLIYRNSGKSIGITLKELEASIQSLAASSKFDDEDIRAGAIEFVKFGNITRGVLESIMKTSVQYAAFTGTNVVQAASAMARAMADPEAASRLLKNAGVALTNTEQKYIATLMESGRMMEAQAIVAKKLADTYAGTEKELRGLGSAHSQVMKEIGEAFEALGGTAPFQFISEASLSGLKMARNIVMDITAALAGEDTTNRFFGRLHPATKGIQDSIDATAKASAPAGGEFAGGVLPSEAKMKSEIAAAEASKKTLENYEKTVTASRDYIAALKLENEQIGMNAVQKRLMGDAAEAAKAPTAALRMEIMASAQALAQSTDASEAAVIATKLLADSVTGLADVGYKQVNSLQQQLDAQRQVNAEISLSAEKLVALAGAKELDEAANVRAAAQYAGPLHDAYIQYADDLEKVAGLQKELAIEKGTTDALKDLDNFLDPAKAQTFGEALRGVFDGAGTSLVKLIDILQVYEIKQAEIEKARKDNTIANSGDAKKLSDVSSALSKKEAKNRITAYADMSRASRGFFKEGSATYEILEGMEKALYIVQMAHMAQKLVTSLFLTATQVRGNVAVTESAVAGAAVQSTANMVVANTSAVAAVANQGKGDPYTAWARIAAMVAVMAGIGLMVAGGGRSKPTVTMDAFAAQKANDGSGTVLGDSKAQSESIQNSLDALESYAKPGLTYTGQMVVLLQDIKNSLTGVTASLLSSGFDSLGSTFKAVSKSSGGVFGMGGKSSSTSLSDLGLAFAEQTVGEAIQSIKLQEYMVTKTEFSKKGVLGIGKKSGTRFDTTFSDLDASISASMSDVVNQMFEIVSKAGKELGTSQQQIDLVKLMPTDLGKVSLFNKTGEEIEAMLSAIFSKLGDSMTKTIIPGIDRFQKVGEGLLETLVRVSSQNEYVNDTFNKLGLSVRLAGDAALDANIGIVDLFGGIQKMSELVATYTDNFYSDTERQAMAMSSLEKEFAAMGKVMPTTNAGFRAMVDAIDLATASGQGMFVSMMKLGEAFASVTEYAIEAAEAATEAAAQLADSSLSALQASVDAEKQKLQSAYDSTAATLTTRISETNSVLSALDATINGLRRSIQTVTLTSRAGADWALQNVLSQVKSGKSITDFADTISGASSVLGQDSSRLYATFADYARAQAKSADILAQIKAAGGAQLTSAEQLLKSIEDGFKAEMAALDQIVIDAQTQINVLLGINTSVLSVAAAVIAVNASIAGLASATATLKSVKSGAGIAQPGMSTDETFVTSLYNRLLGRAPDAAGLAGWTSQLAAGASAASIIAGFTGSQEYMGSHADGLDMVPFDGYVAQLHSGERIKTAAASRQEDAVASEIRSMRVELNSALVAIALNTGDTAKRNRKWDGEGLPATRT